MTYTLYQIKAHNLMVWFTYIYCKMIIAESSVNIHILIQKPYKEKEKKPENSPYDKNPWDLFYVVIL